MPGKIRVGVHANKNDFFCSVRPLAQILEQLGAALGKIEVKGIRSKSK